MAINTFETGAMHVELDVSIAAPKAKVWKALVEETGKWWLRDFYTSSSAKTFVIEPELLGRVYEDWGEGKGQIWYRVMGIDPPNMLQATGHLSAAFGGPGTTILTLTLDESGGVTTLHVSDAVFGRMSKDKPEQTRQGWEALFGALKAHVEQ
jgi:uncharacterized protein YndB with AHSA1/START domain